MVSENVVDGWVFGVRATSEFGHGKLVSEEMMGGFQLRSNGFRGSAMRNLVPLSGQGVN